MNFSFRFLIYICECLDLYFLDKTMMQNNDEYICHGSSFSTLRAKKNNMMLFHIFAEEASLKSFKFFIQKAFLILPAVQLLSRSSPTETKKIKKWSWTWTAEEKGIYKFHNYFSNADPHWSYADQDPGQ